MYAGSTSHNGMTNKSLIKDFSYIELMCISSLINNSKLGKAAIGYPIGILALVKHLGDYTAGFYLLCASSTQVLCHEREQRSINDVFK